MTETTDKINVQTMVLSWLNGKVLVFSFQRNPLPLRATIKDCPYSLIRFFYREDAIPLRQSSESPLWIYLASPVDVAVSKVARFVEVDQSDIRVLAERSLITENEFMNRVEEALLYWVGNDMMLKYNIRDARKIILNASKS
jgi:hypothetical protein